MKGNAMKKTNISFLCLGFIFLIPFLTGFLFSNDPNEPNEENLKKAAQQYLDNKEFPIKVIPASFPMEVLDIRRLFSEQKKIKFAKLLIELGLVQELPPKGDARIFDMTEEGKKYYINIKGLRWDGNDFFCLPKGKVQKVEIVKGPEPRNMLIVTVNVLRAAIYYTIEDVPKWANDERILEYNNKFATMQKQLNQTIRIEREFYQTNNGWKDRSLVKDSDIRNISK